MGPSKPVGKRARATAGGKAKPAVGGKAKPVARAKAKAKPAAGAKATSVAGAKAKPTAGAKAKPAVGGKATAASTRPAEAVPARPAAPHPARAADPPTSSRKAALRLELLRALEHALEIARLAHHAAVEGATHEDARAENDKDTRGLEQSYLARGHARRVAELEAGVAALEAMEWLALEPDTPISLGALVSVEEGDHLRTVLLAAHGGGLTLAGGVTVVTPGSPMGRALLGRVAGDECEVQIGAQPHDLTILTVE